MKIWVVEDDENIRDLVCYALGRGGFDATGFCDGAEFLAAMERETPALVLLDIMLPTQDGLTLLASIRADAKWSGVPVIMLTAKGSELDRVRGLDMGADDYITKPFSVMELMSRINAVLRRVGSAPQEKPLIYGGIAIDDERHVVTVNGEAVTLTLKEYEMLKFLMKNQGIVMSRDKLIERIWGFDFEGETRTVDVHVKTLRQKLGEAGDCIKTVRGVGYCLRD